MDTEAALQILRTFAAVLEQNLGAYRRHTEDYFLTPEWVQTNDLLLGDLQPVRRIAQQIEPELVNRLNVVTGMYLWPWGQARDATVQLIGTLQREEDLIRILGPAGPTIGAAKLHPWVWQPAAALWDDGHYRAALQAAGLQLDTELQAKMNRPDVSGVDLVSQSFSLSPPASGRPRLRFAGYVEDSESFTSKHEGALSFGRGCMQAIRNIATHQSDEPEEQEALEQLAALSVLARWIDDADVVTV